MICHLLNWNFSWSKGREGGEEFHLLLVFGIEGVDEVLPQLSHCHNPKFSFKCHPKPLKELRIVSFAKMTCYSSPAWPVLFPYSPQHYSET